MQKLKGKISISRTHSNMEDDFMSIRVEDDDARVTAVEVKIPLLEFANALTGLSGQSCEFEWNDSGKVGTVGENKTELVPTAGYQLTPQQQIEAIAPYLRDGWFPRESDLTNGHCHVLKDGKHFQRVVFFRNVRKGEGDAHAARRTE